jgi:hypothetical protein
VKKIFLLLSSLVGLACSNKNSIKDYDNASEWLNKPPVGSHYYDTHSDTIMELDCILIPEEFQEKYIKLLTERPFIKANANEYLEITGKNLEKKSAFIVRAVYPHLSGIFRAYEDITNGDVFVDYSVMGSSIKERRKAALLVETEQVPNKLYVVYYVTK